MKFLTRLVASITALLLSTLASAASMPFDEAAFNKAVTEGGPVVVQFHADWCPTCKTQAPIVADVIGQARMQSVKLFVANFDTEKALKKSLKVSSQSTFVVFKGGKEVTRSTGQTSRADIEATFAKAL